MSWSCLKHNWLPAAEHGLMSAAQPLSRVGILDYFLDSNPWWGLIRAKSEAASGCAHLWISCQAQAQSACQGALPGTCKHEMASVKQRAIWAFIGID